MEIFVINCHRMDKPSTNIHNTGPEIGWKYWKYGIKNHGVKTPQGVDLAPRCYCHALLITINCSVHFTIDKIIERGKCIWYITVIHFLKAKYCMIASVHIQLFICICNWWTGVKTQPGAFCPMGWAFYLTDMGQNAHFCGFFFFKSDFLLQ